MANKIVSFTVKLGITALLFVLLFRPELFGLDREFWGADINFSALVEQLREAGAGNLWFWLSFAAVMKMAGIASGILRWNVLLRAQGLRIPLWYLAKCWFVGRFIGLFLPSTLGLDGYRLVESSRHTGEVIKCATVIAVEKLTGFIALFFLVFLTLPLGFRVFDFNLPLLAAVLAFLLAFIAGAFFMLMNPRMIQVIVAVVPVPGVVRRKVDKLGHALTAYGRHRGSLILAVLLGLGVHLGICFMYFGTASAIRAPNTNVLDILFASPLVIVGTVLGPTLSGMGAREFFFSLLLGGKAGVNATVLFGHLGLWIGEMVPLLLSLPLMLLTTRPSRGQLLDEADDARHLLRDAPDGGLHLSHTEIVRYRGILFTMVLAGCAGGLIAGALLGLAEAGWIAATLPGLGETGLFLWGTLVYGVLTACAGAGLAKGLAFLCLSADRFPSRAAVFGLCLGLCAGGGGLVLAVWRYMRDILGGHTPGAAALAVIVLSAALAAIVLCVAGWLAGRTVGNKSRAIATVAAACILLVTAAVGLSALWPVQTAAMEPVPRPEKASGPSVILIVADALRADALAMYDPERGVPTPALEQLAADGVLFRNTFSEASWTKPSFATIFSGAYPEAHTAYTKTATLPGEVVTFPELLREAGYHTQGFANNPNITALFGFAQGFDKYVDLKPNLYFGASVSASKLTGYEVLRKAWQQVEAKLPGGRIRVTDFYQPAESVTATALEWIRQTDRPAPFFLFAHYMDPHDPFMDHRNPGVGYARARLGDPDPEKFREKMLDAYLQDTEHMDRHIGVFLDGLREAGLYDDALIIFTSDHGEEFFDHGGWWHGQSLYDELIRVPLIVKLPGGAAAGTVNNDLARHIDLAPTIFTFTGTPPAESMPGVALLAPDGTAANAGIGYVYSHNDFEGNLLRSVRTASHKLVTANEDNPRKHPPTALFDLLADPGELANIADGTHPEQVRLGEVMEGMQGHILENAAQPSLMDDVPDELREQLGGLGYLE